MTCDGTKWVGKQKVTYLIVKKKGEASAGVCPSLLPMASKRKVGEAFDDDDGHDDKLDSEQVK